MQIMMEEHIYFFCTQFGKKSPTGKEAVNDVKTNENKLKNEKDNSDEKSNVQENNQAQNVRLLKNCFLNKPIPLFLQKLH